MWRKKKKSNGNDGERTGPSTIALSVFSLPVPSIDNRPRPQAGSVDGA